MGKGIYIRTDAARKNMSLAHMGKKFPNRKKPPPFSTEHKLKIKENSKASQFKEKETVGYSAIHRWVYRTFGKAKTCRQCGATEKVQWANKDHTYQRVEKDWLQLCAKCHYKYDRKFNLRNRI